ncbi:uncharacterized protein BDCG_08150 [Blastomyces dermatitidis ER-3]|uniref:Uncharacterized protein n=1 Tax=Ajellomyces dermatitidis (strain ER-3 / ATCC MYA-2586) TaxID=559297 RepID=A0ABP2EN97_AJEDR|nr:uncharacterized protein BDCG_08150 [Blastomyces dermatitidis ER-3]EEQ84881.2 hypothetical protein BDCG_08150 [Blastomyces dermatitidis ER-3]
MAESQQGLTNLGSVGLPLIPGPDGSTGAWLTAKLCMMSVTTHKFVLKADSFLKILENIFKFQHAPDATGFELSRGFVEGGGWQKALRLSGKRAATVIRKNTACN